MFFTNHRNFEKQLFIKEAWRFAVKMMMCKAFASTKPFIIEQFFRLHHKCPVLFQNLLSSENDDLKIDNFTDKIFLKFNKHKNIMMIKKFTRTYMKKRNLFIFMSHSDKQFRDMMKTVMKKYDIQTFDNSKRSLY